MILKRRQCTREFQFQVVRKVEAGKPLAPVARVSHVQPTVRRRWQQDHQRHAEWALAGHGHSSQAEARRAAWERRIGHLIMAHALLKKVLRRLDARHQDQNGRGGSSWAR